MDNNKLKTELDKVERFLELIEGMDYDYTDIDLHSLKNELHTLGRTLHKKLERRERESLIAWQGAK
jgi:hypothetical protein